MKKNYNRLKWLAVVILAILLYFFAEPARAGVPSDFTLNILQQEVRGVVTDTAGMPLTGVTVFVKGKNKGTTTDIEGKYSLLVEPGDILTFSFLGFKTLEEPINGRREVWVQLEEDISTLGEVQINAGYYNTTKRESTGNISRVTAEEIELQPVISPLQALQGRMAGVEIIPGGSQPGMAPTIRIRGQNSLRSEGNFPLYIIDGLPINSTPVDSNSLLGNPGPGIDPLNTLNLANIESIEILKDADATAIYGSRGANGVVLITTKKGNQKKGIEARAYKGISEVPNKVELLNTEQYIQIRKLAFENDAIEPTPFNAYDLVLWDQNRYTDWQEFFFGGTSETTNANLTYSGGSANTSFRIGSSYFTQGTVFPGDYNYEKVTGELGLNHDSKNGRLNLNLAVNYGVDVNNSASNLSLINPAFSLPPNAPAIFNEDGSLNWKDWSEAGLDNPLAGFFNTSATQTNNLVTNFAFSYELLEGFTYKMNLGYTSFTSKELWKRPIRSYSPSNQETHNSFHLNLNRRSWIVEPQLLYSESFGNLNLETILGITFQETADDRLELQGTGYASEALIGNLAAADRVINASTSNVDYRYYAVFTRLGMNWNKKYYLNLTGRRDGSSRFGPDKRFANFGAVGAAWIFTEESAIKEAVPTVSFGKLRGSYGTTGSDQIGDYGYLDAYEATPGPGGLYPTMLANSQYSWEINKKMEAALEIGLFKDRVMLMGSWYLNRSSNQLVGYPLPAITGFPSVQANLPATVQNSGWEVEASSLISNIENFRWEASFNISFPLNELVSYPSIEQSSYANTYRVGHPLNISLLYQYEGLDPETELYTIKDINNDGRYDHEDRIIIQDENKEFFGGLNNNISFKNFSMQFLLHFVKQKGSFALFHTGRPSNSSPVVLQSLQEGSRFQRVSQLAQANTAFSRIMESDFPIEDASFLRLKTLSFGYSLPNTIFTNLPVKSGRLFIHAQNLFTVTSYNGLDPEIPYSGTSFASLKTVTGGIHLTL